MDLLPLDLLNVLADYLPYSVVPELEPRSKSFYINNLLATLGPMPKFINMVWDYPDFYPLSNKENFIRVLSWFGLIVPGSEKFLTIKKCYDLAIISQNVKVINYFGHLFNKSEDKIQKDIKKFHGPVANFILGVPDKWDKIFEKVKKGQLDRNQDPDPREQLFISVYYGQTDLTEKIMYRYDFDISCLENDLLLTYIIKGNLKELKDTFSTIPSYTENILERADLFIPQVSSPILFYIMEHMNIKNFLDHPPLGPNSNIIRLFALIYEYHPEQIIPMKCDSLFIPHLCDLPGEFYFLQIIFNFNADQLIQFNDDYMKIGKKSSINLETLNIFSQQLEKNGRAEIAKKIKTKVLKLQ